GREHIDRIPAGVHVDRSTRAQHVHESETGFGALLSAVAGESGLPGLVNTSLNVRGEPMVLTPDQAVDLMAESEDIDILAMPPYVVRRS
ncbi:MAG TPA: carbamoyltransferase C-terminal domain-containing protein, partial [Pseudonocardiaceae bacterium]|nr:carbamoyltransferase C-terminal domain-containing protein [Pseudonocardiaceae bacterium]